MGRNSGQTPSFTDTGDSFLRKPQETANYLNDFFINKMDKLRQEMSSINCTPSHECRI